MASRANPWAQGLSNLGTALFGSAQEDAALAQAQAEMARRQKLMTDRRIAQETFNIEQGQNRALQRVRGAAAALDPTGSGYAPTAQQLFSQAFGLGADPDTFSQALTLASNLGGGDYGTISRTFSDPSAIATAQDRMAAQARTADLFAENEAYARALEPYGGLENAPQNLQTSINLSRQFGAPLGDTMIPAMGLDENIGDPSGNVFRVGPRFVQDQVDPLVFTGDPARVRLGQQPIGQLGRQQAAAVGQARPQPAQAPQQGQPVQRLPQSVANEMPEGETERPPRPQGFNAQQVNTGIGTVEIPQGPAGEPTSMFDMIEFSSGLGAGLQRGLSQTLGQFSDELFFEAPVALGAEMVHLNTELRPLMTVSNRPSQWELQDIQPALLNDSIVRNPAQNAEVLRVLRNRLISGRQEALENLASGNLDPQAEKELNNAVRHADSLLRKIGQPRQISGAEANIQRFSEIGQRLFGGQQELQQFQERAGQALSTGEAAPAQDDDMSWLFSEEAIRAAGGDGGG